MAHRRLNRCLADNDVCRSHRDGWEREQEDAEDCASENRTHTARQTANSRVAGVDAVRVTTRVRNRRDPFVLKAAEREEGVTPSDRTSSSPDIEALSVPSARDHSSSADGVVDSESSELPVQGEQARVMNDKISTRTRLWINGDQLVITVPYVYQASDKLHSELEKNAIDDDQYEMSTSTHRLPLGAILEVAHICTGWAIKLPPEVATALDQSGEGHTETRCHSLRSLHPRYSPLPLTSESGP